MSLHELLQPGYCIYMLGFSNQISSSTCSSGMSDKVAAHGLFAVGLTCTCCYHQKPWVIPKSTRTKILITVYWWATYHYNLNDKLILWIHNLPCSRPVMNYTSYSQTCKIEVKHTLQSWHTLSLSPRYYHWEMVPVMAWEGNTINLMSNLCNHYPASNSYWGFK